MRKTNKNKILVTAALPYANGPIHLGHMVEYIQADIFVRFMKLIGEDIIYCCADDTHGTPIEIKAMQLKMTPEQLIEKYHKEHTEDFKNFLVEFDNYYTTNSPENKEFSEFIFQKLKEKNAIYQKEVKLVYCAHCKRFLPDRYVKGKCPKCGAEEQYGDVCEKCGSAHKTIDLIEPKCAICGNKPEVKSSKHYFFKLSEYSTKLEEYFKKQNFQKEIVNFLMNWLKNLEDWCISRDGPYFGFKIPGEDDKYFYVWLDAPVGYIASTANYCKKTKKCDAKDYWNAPNTRIIHFIGKDIIYFHFLFWPAMLMTSGFNLPNNIYVHGFLTVNKEKMSKSRGTFITAKDYLKLLNPEYLRFYYAANLTYKMNDIDLDLADFKEKLNNELIGNISNLAYRALTFTNKNFDSKITEIDDEDAELAESFEELFEKIKADYEGLEFREAVKNILHIGALGNKHFQENEPWKLIREDLQKAQRKLTFSINLVKNLSILLMPILPKFSSELQKQLNLKNLAWKDLNFELKNHKINNAAILMSKIEHEADSLIKPEFLLDLRVGKIESAEEHPDADKLYVLQVDLGSEKRQLVAGVKKHYKKEELLGKQIIVLCNLEPAKLRGIESKGMLLAAEFNDKVIVLMANKSKVGEQVYFGEQEKRFRQISYKEFSEIKMSVKNKNVVYDGKLMQTASEKINVNIEDNAIIK